MYFRDFFEQQAGYDEPFGHEVETLRKLHTLDPISQAKLDLGLHDKALSKPRFDPQANAALQEDMPLKQKVIQIFSGQIKDPSVIQAVVQDLKKDQQTHLVYLRQPPHENTGSHVWHRAWAKIYEDWINQLAGA